MLLFGLWRGCLTQEGSYVLHEYYERLTRPRRVRGYLESPNGTEPHNWTAKGVRQPVRLVCLPLRTRKRRCVSEGTPSDWKLGTLSCWKSAVDVSIDSSTLDSDHHLDHCVAYAKYLS